MTCIESLKTDLNQSELMDQVAVLPIKVAEQLQLMETRVAQLEGQTHSSIAKFADEVHLRFDEIFNNCRQLKESQLPSQLSSCACSIHEQL